MNAPHSIRVQARAGVGARVAALALFAALALVALPAAARAADVHAHALLDLTAATHGPALPLTWEDPGVSAFDPYTLRVFADGRATSTIEGHAQIVFHEAIAPRLIGAYALYTPWPARDLHLAAGKIPWWIGSYSDREYSDKNPLVGTPLLYQYRTPHRWYDVDKTADKLLFLSGRSPGGGPTPGGPIYGIGVPVIWESWWDVGVMALGSVRPLEFSLGVVSGTPSWGSPGEEENNGKSFLGRVGIAPSPAVRAGLSGSIGPYLLNAVRESLPLGKNPEDYDQKLVMADAEVLVAHVELRAEGYANTWQTPWLGNLHVRGYYVESKYTLPAGWYVAGRWEIERFSKILDSTGLAQPWDINRNRAEVGVGYRLSKGVIAKAVAQRNVELAASPGETTEHEDLAAASVTIKF